MLLKIEKIVFFCAAICCFSFFILILINVIYEWISIKHLEDIIFALFLLSLIIFIGIVFLKAAGIIKLNNHIDIKDFCKWEINILILLIAITCIMLLIEGGRKYLKLQLNIPNNLILLLGVCEIYWYAYLYVPRNKK